MSLRFRQSLRYSRFPFAHRSDSDKPASQDTAYLISRSAFAVAKFLKQPEIGDGME
jgi:hypothetical protein